MLSDTFSFFGADQLKNHPVNAVISDFHLPSFSNVNVIDDMFSLSPVTESARHTITI